ncbi:MAG TPA: transcriptional repressor [Gammaproteobacteria bacterium]|nr:transcriptional repressor [Gammaproteobacteria bacterium]
MSETVPLPMLGEDEAARRLRDYDILPTQQRLQIAQVLLTRDQHLSAEQVLDLVNASGSRVSKATVYNTLGLFAQKGIVREVNVDPSRVFYDTNNSLHHHFYNIDSGELLDIEPSQMPVNPLPEAPEGSVVESVEVIVRIRSKTAAAC